MFKGGGPHVSVVDKLINHWEYWRNTQIIFKSHQVHTVGNGRRQPARSRLIQSVDIIAAYVYVFRVTCVIMS